MSEYRATCQTCDADLGTHDDRFMAAVSRALHNRGRDDEHWMQTRRVDQ